MPYRELNLEQRRQLVDTTQTFEALRVARSEFEHGYRGSMLWKRVNGHAYLYRKQGAVWRSLGPKSDETERIKGAYAEARPRLRQRITRLKHRLNEMARVNRALRLGRMPRTPARVLRKLDEAGLLGKQLYVVGTHALYAYEARSGVLFDNALTATTDIDLLVDARAGMSFAVAESVNADGVIGLLRKVDKSFQRTQDFRATNDDGYYVDIIAPMQTGRRKPVQIKLGDVNDDLVAAEMLGLKWLINAPRFEAVIVGEDGLPLWMSCIDPRAFALHKYWVSKRPERDPIKSQRDVAQATAVYDVARSYLNLSFRAKDLSALPMQLIQSASELAAAAKVPKPPL